MRYYDRLQFSVWLIVVSLYTAPDVKSAIGKAMTSIWAVIRDLVWDQSVSGYFNLAHLGIHQIL